MAESIVFSREGFADENRDATRLLESELRSATGREDIYCTYNGERNVVIHTGTDELNQRTWQRIAIVTYELNAALDTAAILDVVRAELDRREGSPENPAGSGSGSVSL